MEESRRIRAFEAIILVALWGQIVLSVALARGVFDWLGVDYAIFATGAKLLVSAEPASVYDLDAITRGLRPFEAYYGPEADPLKVGPTPYPAPMFLLYAPFAPFAPLVGFGLWAAASVALAAVVVRGLTASFPDRSWGLTALLLTYFPLAYSVFVGQPVAVLLFAFAMAYRAWGRGRDFEAGMWAGVLFLKVQYPAFLGLVLLYRCRWRSLAGLATTGLLMLGCTLAFVGTRGVAAYATTLRAMSGFRHVHPLIYPQQMINWRGLLVNVLPASVSESQGQALTVVLAALTASTLLVIWRGPWEPTGPRFAMRMLATMLVTMLATFHNHIHGATLLLVPGLALMAQPGGPPALRWLLRAGLYLPTAVFAMTRTPERVSFLLIGLMVAALAVIVREEAFPERAFAADGPRSRPHEA